MKIKMIVVLTILVGLLVIACQKPVTSEPKKVDQAQTSRTENKEVPQPEQQKTSQPAKNPVQELSPLERARGKEIKDENGLPIVTWGSLKDLPTLDEVFPVVDKLPEGVQFAKGADQIELPATAERKQLMKNVISETSDKLYAVRSPNGQCIVELYGGTPRKGKREDWLRGIDPKTKEVLWKYDEPGLADLDAYLDFAHETDDFILTNFYDKANKGWPVKLFSCGKGYISEIYIEPEAALPPPFPMARIARDGKHLLITTGKGEIVYFETGGQKKWSKKITEHSTDVINASKLSPDGKYYFVFVGSARSKIDKYCCAINMLFEAETGNLVWKFFHTKRLGDEKTLLNFYEAYTQNNALITGSWHMDPGFLDHLENKNTERRNPYGNILLLVTKTGNAYAFRMLSLGFRLSDDGRYLFANNKYYELNSLLQGGR